MAGIAGLLVDQSRDQGFDRLRETSNCWTLYCGALKEMDGTGSSHERTLATEEPPVSPTRGTCRRRCSQALILPFGGLQSDDAAMEMLRLMSRGRTRCIG